MSGIIQQFNHYRECSFPLSNWVIGNDLFTCIITQIECYIETLRQLNEWRQQRLLLEKPTLSSSSTLVFWVHESVIDKALLLVGVQGGFHIRNSHSRLPDSSQYKGKKQSPRPRRVILDIGCDDQKLIEELKSFGLEIVCLWDYIADVLHYEIIEVCTSQYIDLLVTKNERLMKPAEEWLTYLMPHRTRLFFLLNIDNNVRNLAQEIYRRAYLKRNYKQNKKEGKK